MGNFEVISRKATGQTEKKKGGVALLLSVALGLSNFFVIWSKSDSNNLSCTILYSSNSLSANCLAISAVILPESYNTCLSLNFKKAFNFFDQSSIVIGIFLFA